MQYRFLLFAAMLAAARIAVAQSGMQSTCDVNSCKATFTFGPLGIGNSASAVYSGRETREMLTKLPNGTYMPMHSGPSSVIYRDSQARIRIEYSISPSRPRARPLPFEVPWVEIQDPLAGYLYVLDSAHHVAHRVKVHPQEPTVRPALVYDAPAATKTGDTVSLGTKFMFGVMLTGVQTTSVGLSYGKSITNVTEVWTDPQTNIVVLRKGTSPNSEFTMMMQNYSNAEPDSALFLVPSDYQVVDETGPFTIVVSRTGN